MNGYGFRAKVIFEFFLGGGGFKLHLQHWTQMLPQVGLTSTSPPVYRGRSRLSEQREPAFTIFYDKKVVSEPNFDTKSPPFVVVSKSERY